jgi:SAM-dependent methyltransferase
MVYLNPIMTTKATIDYYTNLNTGQGEIVSSDDKFYREIYTLGLNSIEHFIAKGSLLDIGCSTGFFLDLAKERDWRTAGLELGIDESVVAEKKGHKIFKSTIESLDPEKIFDVITMWDVLEHIPDGISQLNLIREHLTKKGILFFQIPNSDSLAAKVLRQDCRMFDGLEHTNLYNPLTVRQIAESCGFTVKEMRSVISEIAVLNNYLDYENPYFGSSQYNRKVVNLLDDDFIHSNLIGYKLQVTLQKK